LQERYFLLVMLKSQLIFRLSICLNAYTYKYDIARLMY
jgi:hypothetical protein